MNLLTKRYLLKLLILAASVICLTGCITGRSLVIENLTEDDVLFSEPVAQIDYVIYHYTQSYDRGLITEFFSVTDAGLVPTKMIFDTDSYDYHGTRYPQSIVTKSDDTYLVEISETSAYPEIDYRVGYTIEQQMEIHTSEGIYHLTFQNAGDPGDHISVRLH